MDTLLQHYKKVFSDLDALNRELALLYREVDTAQASYFENVSKANRLLQEKLEENKQRIAKVNAFIGIAKTHSTKHIEAASAKPFDSGALSRLSVQINSGWVDDPFAIQLYTEATAQLKYLNAEIYELEKRKDQYIEGLASKLAIENRDIENRISAVKAKITAYLNSETFSGFVSLLRRDKSIFNVENDASALPPELLGTISLGSVEFPFPVPRGVETELFAKLKDVCNIAKSAIMVPANITIVNGCVMIAEYKNASEELVLKGIQNIILNMARYYGHHSSQITFVDPIRFNASSLGSLSKLCGVGCYIDSVPTSEEGIRKKIKSIISDIDTKNSHIDVTAEKKVYIFHDFPQAYDSTSIGLIQQLCANAAYYGIIVILTHNVSSAKQVAPEIYQFIENTAISITADGANDCFYFNQNNVKYEFTWYLAPSELPDDIERKYIYEKPVINLDNHYIKRVGMELAPHVKKGVRELENIPYGVDGSGNILYLDFENSNYATYICGASRSGKSTLIHTIITGVLQTTHPDNIEIWLVDFGKTELSRYANKEIPHIRYIILDESPELVYDLVDRLTEILRSRQNKFQGKWEKLSDVPAEQYMPEILVIIDEFSIMSNVLADSIVSGKEDYRIKFQTILAEGAKHGMRFIFSCQGYTEGVRGLTPMAKEQIQQRIAMKADYNEIKSTLALKTISDRDELLMEQLPVHYALKRIPLTAQGDRLSNAHVLYIPSADSQLPLIENLKSNFSPDKIYDITNYNSYIHKRPLIKDGNTFEVFEAKRDMILRQIEKVNRNSDDKEISLFIGSPQRMLQFYPIIMVDGFCENCLLIAPTREKASGASLAISAVSSLKMQDIKTECWTSGRNPIYRQIINDCGFSFDAAFVRIENICARISRLKQAIENKIEANLTIFIMNYETIMMDMQYLAEEMKSSENPDLERLKKFGSIKREEGETDLNTFLDLELGSDAEVATQRSDTPTGASKHVDIAPSSGVYDARGDLNYILTHGPRWGYHFVMLFDTCGDFRQTRLDEALFRHKIMFQTAKNEAVGIVGPSFAGAVSNLANHTFRYTNGIEEVSFRPYLHNGICIDGWTAQGHSVVSRSNGEEDYLE